MQQVRMKLMPALSELTAQQLVQRAQDYRAMAATATTASIKDSLNRLAVKFADLAAQREISGHVQAKSKSKPPARPQGPAV